MPVHLQARREARLLVGWDSEEQAMRVSVSHDSHMNIWKFSSFANSTAAHFVSKAIGQGSVV